MSPDAFRDFVLSLSGGRSLDRGDLIETLIRLGYSRTESVENPGEFSIRGGIMDLYSTAGDQPVRLDWSADRIESIRTFNPETQISTGRIARIWILPAHEPPDQAAGSLLDYLPSGTRYVSDEPGLLETQMEEFNAEVRLAFSSMETGGKTAAPRDRTDTEQIYLKSEELTGRMKAGPSIVLETLHLEDREHEGLIAFSTRPPDSLGLGQKGTPLSDSLTILDQLRGKAHVIFVAKTAVQQNRLIDLFRQHDLAVASWPAGPQSSPDPDGPPPASRPLTVAVGTLSSGFIDLTNRLAVLTDEDLFGRSTPHRPPPKPHRSKFLASLEDLEEGDYVVHVQHGIARYEGLKRLSIQEYESDFLILHYLGGDTLYLPSDRLNLIQKYTGIEGQRPKLDRLGGITWARTTQRVRKAVETIAKDILELYAAREATSGIVFSADSDMSREFDAAFAYEETPDQLRAIEDLKRDMEQPRPMDRLICGDVGYGKTEVAMRATFKAVMDGKQVAVLVPTTLLAQQHGQTFRERFAPFPVCIETLSRFRTPKEQKAVLADLAGGRVDIIIGTHRLLQKDISFHDLGLLIIDEEQRFGVSHKEKLKQLRKNVDTLTLTATPIPRTLQMGLTGIRELSIIDTPPADRLAIRTILTRFDHRVIRKAILRELSRGGQVF